jgi:alpha-beta hydrolase superfamily lysophospholipase
MGCVSRRLTFYSDVFRIAGVLHLPDIPCPPVVIGVHGLLSDKSSPKQIALARACNRIGLGYFRFDHRGCGESQGVFKEVTTFEGRCRDLAAAIETLFSLPDTDNRIALFGSSLGGAVSIHAASAYPVSAVVTWATPISGHDLAVVLKNPMSGVPDAIASQLDFDLRDTLPGISNILAMHGGSDDLIPPDHGREICRLAADPKRFVLLAGGDHRMSDTRHQEMFLREASRWFQNAFERRGHGR